MKIFDNIEFLIGPDGKIVGCRSGTEKHKTLRIAIISCSKKKQKGIHRADELYISAFFRASLAYALENFDRVYILSAKYGLLTLHRRVKTYEKSIRSLSGVQRRRWAEKVAGEMRQYLRSGSRITFFCGELYRKDLLPLLKEDFQCSAPLKGLSLGKQLQWYKLHRTNHRR